MELTDLRYFLNVATSRSFARGAERSHVTPPAVSKMVRKLEEELGVELLTRTTRSVLLTPEGEALLQCAQRVLNDVEALRGELDAHRNVVRGNLRIAGMEVFSSHLLPRALAGLLKDHPDVTPQVFEMIPQRMVPLLLEGRLDAGFTIGAETWRGVDVNVLGRSAGVVVCGHSHPLYGKRRVTRAVVDEHPFVVPRFLGSEGLPSLDGYPEEDRPRRVGATIELMQTGVQLCIEGALLGYFPEISVAHHVKTGALRVLWRSDGAGGFELQALTRAASPRRPALAVLMRHLKQGLASA